MSPPHPRQDSARVTTLCPSGASPIVSTNEPTGPPPLASQSSHFASNGSPSDSSLPIGEQVSSKIASQIGTPLPGFVEFLALWNCSYGPGGPLISPRQV